MKMASSTMLGVILSVAMFSAGAVVDRVTNVYVTNFPLDPQGNIRVTTMNKDQNVTLTNLPLDERGNIRVTEMNGEQTEPSWKVISVVENFNLTWTPKLSDNPVYTERINLGSTVVSGYSRMKVYMKVTNFTLLYQGQPNTAGIYCWVYSVYDYGEMNRYYLYAGWRWDTTSKSLFTIHPLDTTIMDAVVEPCLRLEINGESITPNGPVLPAISCLVSIGIYVRNE